MSVMKFVRYSAIVACGVLPAISPAAAQSGKSLAKCEKAIGKEMTKYSGAVQKSVAKCLDKIATEVLAKGDPIADAAKSCASALRKIENSENADKTLSAKFVAKVAKACDPASLETKATHTQNEALDPNDAGGLQAGLLDAYCGEFGGDGTLDTVSEWIACADGAAFCTALQQVAVEYPRAPEWLGDITIAIAALDPNEPKYTDAASAASNILARIDGDADGTADIVCGTTLAAVSCGDGVVDTGEDCDFGDLNGDDCSTIGEGFVAGTLACGAGCTFDTAGCITPHIFFRTQNDYTGNLGGLVGADSICQGLADGAGLDGTFKAVLSTSSVDAKDRFIEDGRPVYNTLGNKVTDSLTDLFAANGIGIQSLRPDASGAQTSLNGRTYTGSLAGGVVNTGNTCADWTSSGGNASQGTADGANSTWIFQQLGGCNGPYPIYCIGD